MARSEEIDKAGMEWYSEIKNYDADVATAFMAGAQWADRTMINKACEWLVNELPKYIFEGRNGKSYISVAMVDDFKKAMKGGEE